MFLVLLLPRIVAAHVVLILSAVVLLLFLVLLVFRGSLLSVRGDAFSLFVVVVGSMLVEC